MIPEPGDPRIGMVPERGLIPELGEPQRTENDPRTRVVPEGEGAIPVLRCPDGAEQITAVAIVFL